MAGVAAEEEAVTGGEAAGLAGSRKGWRCSQLNHNWSSLCLQREQAKRLYA